MRQEEPLLLDSHWAAEVRTMIEEAADCEITFADRGGIRPRILNAPPWALLSAGLKRRARARSSRYWLRSRDTAAASSLL